jgi:hypothetical protein
MEYRRVIRFFFEYRRRDLTAKIAVDTRVVHEETTGNIFGISEIRIGQNSMLPLKGQFEFPPIQMVEDLIS